MAPISFRTIIQHYCKILNIWQIKKNEQKKKEKTLSYILICVRVALAASDVQSILDIPATDEIHMEDRNHGLA